MPLASQVVDSIFARMLARYGSAWLAKWAGVPMEAVKADWASELGGFSRDAIFYALRYLPAEHPPTVAQFKEICIRAPAPMPPALPAPKVSRQLVASYADTLRAKWAERDKLSPLQWAYDLQERERLGETLLTSQRIAWREALAKAPLKDILGDFTPVQLEKLPPGMRPDAGLKERAES